MRRLIPTTMMVLAMTILSACGKSGHDPERYVLTGNNTNLFYQKQLTNDPDRADQMIAAVRQFATDHGMDFLLARDSLRPGEFNTSANGPTLNIKALYLTGTDMKGVIVYAIVPKTPTAKDKELVADFVARVERAR